MTNLVANAVQHGGKRSPICLTGHGLPAEITIAVANRGSVIPREQIGRLFEAMKKTVHVSRIDDQHLGLGLYIVDKIIEAHEGSIRVESNEAAGTIFTIRLGRGE
jgi:phosphoserine phosphatase RsbU/P